MSQFKIIPIALIFASLFSAGTSLAQSRSGFGSRNYDFTARSSAREQKRWTLAEWLEQKDRSKMMDLWLAFNSPSPYELMLGVGYLSYTTHIDSPLSDESHNSLNGEFCGLCPKLRLKCGIRKQYAGKI